MLKIINLYPQKTNLIPNQVIKENQLIIVLIIINIKIHINTTMRKKNKTIVKKVISRKINLDQSKNMMEINSNLF
jgi:hypothetical protein